MLERIKEYIKSQLKIIARERLGRLLYGFFTVENTASLKLVNAQ